MQQFQLRVACFLCIQTRFNVTSTWNCENFYQSTENTAAKQSKLPYSYFFQGRRLRSTPPMRPMQLLSAGRRGMSHSTFELGEPKI